MASFQILGRGKSSGRQRKRSVRAIDQAAALALMEAEGTLVDHCVELPYPQASPELRDHVASLGIRISEDSSRPECVFEILRWCLVNRRHAAIRYLTDVEGNPWSAHVEPHGFQRSPEGFRLRCYLPAHENEPDVVSDFQVSGWHLYLLEDIDSVEATESKFEPRPYRRTDDEASMTISFRVEKRDRSNLAWSRRGWD
jgi:hypothetical protein